MTATMSRATYQSFPMDRTLSPFKHPRSPPCTPAPYASTGETPSQSLSEKTQRREAALDASIFHARELDSPLIAEPFSQEADSLLPPSKSPPTPAMLAPGAHLDFGFMRRSKKRYKLSPTSKSCRTCRQPISTLSGHCAECTKTAGMLATLDVNTPTRSTARRNFVSMDHSGSQEVKNGFISHLPSSPKSTLHRVHATHASDPPIRLSSLHPPPPLQASARVSSDSQRTRKGALVESNEPVCHPQIMRKPVPAPHMNPQSPGTPPSTAHSEQSSSQNRPSSLANITTPPTRTVSRQHSGTPSELSTLYPYLSSASTTSPPGTIGRASTQWPNTTSAWDEWDSDEEEKAGLVRYWKGRKWRGSRGSLSGSGMRRDSQAKEVEEPRFGHGRNRSRLVRALSCGCNRD